MILNKIKIVSHSPKPVELSQVAGWCGGEGLSSAIKRLWVQILITAHAADGDEFSTHRPLVYHYY